MTQKNIPRQMLKPWYHAYLFPELWANTFLFFINYLVSIIFLKTAQIDFDRGEGDKCFEHVESETKTSKKNIQDVREKELEHEGEIGTRNEDLGITDCAVAIEASK